MIENFYNSLLLNLNNNNCNFIVCGSHSLYSLNNKYNLNIDINLINKDLDLLIDDSCVSFISQEYDISYTKSSFWEIYRLHYNNLKVDFIKNIYKRVFSFINSNQLILGVNYDNIKDYCYKDHIYDNYVNIIDLGTYYGMIKNSGLTKYKTIINQILSKYPNLSKEILA